MTDASQNPHDAMGVSVIIPAYNYARYLPEAIASALAQPYSPMEVLVVDDGSTDETPQILAHISDPRLRVVRQENAGLSAARNRGLSEAKYPFVAFLDADDRWTTQFLPKVMARFRELPEDYAITASFAQRMTADGQLVKQQKSFISPPASLTAREFILRNRVFPSAVVARRSAFDVCGGFDTSLRSSEDRDMWIRITSRFRAAYLGEELVHIRRHGANMSKHAARMRENTGRTLGKAFRSGCVSRWNLPFWATAFSYFNFTSAGTFFSAGRRFKALALLALSFLLCPIFLRPSRVGEKPLFRLRALRHFLMSPAETAGLPLVTPPRKTAQPAA